MYGSRSILASSLLVILTISYSMVEGHGVHRVAALHGSRLVGKRFTATSPNGRFREGAAAINGKVLTRVEAVGKNLFAFFESGIVVHVHFGMAGAWSVYAEDEAVPEPTRTNRLRLEYCADAALNKKVTLTADLSAMTVDYGTMDLYDTKRAKLGQDPLRDDADPDKLWEKVSTSKKSIGALIMDQAYFTGPGNIYRAEILFKAGIHPNIPGNQLQRHEFDEIWKHTVALLVRGFQTGSILTVDPDEAAALGKPDLRRYIYNRPTCGRCNTRIQTWPINNRTCYACPTCQRHPNQQRNTNAPTAPIASAVQDCVPFLSHCAKESASVRLFESGAGRLTVSEIKEELEKRHVTIPVSAKKIVLVKMLQDQVNQEEALKTPTRTRLPVKPTAVTPDSISSANRRRKVSMLSSEEAAAEKARANESLAVEHLAELAPAQARRARAQAGEPLTKRTRRSRK